MKDEEMFEKIATKVVDSAEDEFLKYLIDCCENVLENEATIMPFLGTPLAMQMMKLRAEVTLRLKSKGIEYGKFATSDHLLSYKNKKEQDNETQS